MVEIKDQYLKELPFCTLKTRRGLAVVFTFFGDREEGGEFMRKASHKTRAYYLNAMKLKGFLKPYPIIKEL